MLAGYVHRPFGKVTMFILENTVQNDELFSARV